MLPDEMPIAQDQVRGMLMLGKSGSYPQYIITNVRSGKSIYFEPIEQM